MNIEDIRNYCLTKKGATECFPFDEDTLVFKVVNKIFALISLSESNKISLKCIPEKAIELRERYTNIIPAYHMNKKHWITFVIDIDTSDSLLKTLIDESYDLVVSKLPKKLRQTIENL